MSNIISFYYKWIILNPISLPFLLNSTAIFLKKTLFDSRYSHSPNEIKILDKFKDKPMMISSITKIFPNKITSIDLNGEKYSINLSVYLDIEELVQKLIRNKIVTRESVLDFIIKEKSLIVKSDYRDFLYNSNELNQKKDILFSEDFNYKVNNFSFFWHIYMAHEWLTFS